MSEGVQILLVEDDSEKRCAAVRALARTGRAVIEAATGADALAVLRRGGDFVVLLALALPDMDGRDLLARITADHPDTPAVIVTGVDDVAVAIDAMQRGAWDYVVARADGSHLIHLSHVVARTLERLQLVRDRNRYREEVEALAIALRGTTDGVVILDPVGRIAFVNRALAQAWRQPESAIVGRHLGDFVSMHGAQVDLGDVLAAIGARGRWSGELSTRAVEAPERVWDVTLTPIRCPEPAPGGLLGHSPTAVGISRDASEKQALEQLRRAPGTGGGGAGPERGRPRRVGANEPQPQRVVANLLGNAIKYTETGGRVTVSPARENGLVPVAFRDPGRGIRADEIPRLFEK